MSAALSLPADPVEALFVRWRDHGDGRALALLFDRTASDLFRIALSVAPDAATAEEAVQETFLAVIEDPRRCDPSQPLMPWLVGVLRHKVVDARRRARRVPDPLRVEPRVLPEDPADGAARREATDRVRAAIDRLPEPYRGVAMLRWEYGLEPGEIAHARGEPPGTVRSTLSRALERLRHELGGVTAIALVLGVRPPDGLAAIRRRVLARAGVPVAGAAAGFVVAGVLVGKTAAAAVVLAALVAGGLAGMVAGRASTETREVRHEDAIAAAQDDAAGRGATSVRPQPSRGAPPAEDAARATRPLRQRAASPAETSAVPTSAPRTDEAVKADVARALTALDGTWATAWKVGQDLAKLPSQPAVLAALRDAWPRLGDATDRQNLMKGFDYDGSSSVRLDVLDLGARDPDPAVRWYALSYFEPYAGRRMVDAPDAWRAWRETTAGASPESLLDAAGARLLAALRDAAPSERQDLVTLLTDVFAHRGTAHPSRDGVLAAASAWYADSAWLANPRPLARLLAAAQLPDDAARALYDTLHAQGNGGTCRALVLVGALEARWAHDDVVSRLRAADADVAAAAAAALADLGGLRDAASLVAAFDVHPEGRAAVAIAAALQELTGVSSWRGKDASWWREWWVRNRGDVTASPAEEERQ